MTYLDSLSKEMMNMIAEEQGKIFEFAENSYDIKKFIDFYMNSDFCNLEMDSVCSFFHFKPVEVCFPYIEQECQLKKEDNSDDSFNSYWVGMIYRHLVYHNNISSKKLIEMLSPEELNKMFYWYELYNIEDTVSDISLKYGLSEKMEK